MTGFLLDAQELKPGLIVFRRADVKHQNWYCRIKVPQERRYKTISLKTSVIGEAKDKAFDLDADIRFRKKHDVPIFDKSFEQVATEYSANLKNTVEVGQISLERWQHVDSYIRNNIVGYVGNAQISNVGEEIWKGYPLWRKKNGKSHGGTAAKDGTIRHEMITFRSILRFAADKNYIRENQVPRGKLAKSKARREAFSPQEYRQLHTFARGWVKKAKGEHRAWYRAMVYNFVLIMANTGMRPPDAKNLRWRDVDVRSDRQGRSFVCLNVHGKGKFRELVAASNVASYFDRVRRLSKATQANDFVFSDINGQAAKTLYSVTVKALFKDANLLVGPQGTHRSTYSLRHTYATFRLMEGIDVYFLAKQMGTSVQMIEDHYGHITPTKNAERILEGLPGWEPVVATPDAQASVNAGASKKAPKPAKRKR